MGRGIWIGNEKGREGEGETKRTLFNFLFTLPFLMGKGFGSEKEGKGEGGRIGGGEKVSSFSPLFFFLENEKKGQINTIIK